MNDENNNKFNFDKVIFVCDIENIQKIFSARYGTDVDFNGYIDKFYSREIFYFINIAATKGQIRNILTSIFIDSFYEKLLLEYSFVEDLLILMVYSKSINLRALLRLLGTKYEIDNKVIVLKNVSDEVKSSDLGIIVILDFLNKFFGDANVLLKAIINSEKYIKGFGKGFIRFNEMEMLELLLPILDYERTKLNNGSYEYTYKFGGEYPSRKDIEIKYSLQRDYGYYGVRIKDATLTNSMNPMDRKTPPDLKIFNKLIEVTEKLIAIGVLK